MIYVLYGQPGSGKTTLSEKLCNHIAYNPAGCDPVVLDGDEFRELFKNKNYSKEGRYQNIRNANAIATYANNVLNRDVIMALVNPYQHLRAELRTNNPQVIEILLESDRDVRREYHVKDFEVGTPDIRINTDKNVHASWLDLLSELNNSV